jgi:L-ascorbate oxidase
MKITKNNFRDTGKNKADNILINGHGRLKDGPKTPRATFHVMSGKRYRFRIVSPGFTLCPIEVSIDNHTLTLIASDTASIQPIEVNSFILHAGER